MPKQENHGSFAALNATTGESIDLAMQQLWLTGEVLPVGARLWIQHQFRSNENQPLEVIYSFPLPRDAALRRFRIQGEGFSVHSDLKPVAEAENRYETAIEEGHLSALARVHRDGLVNLAVGNLRPQEAVTVTLEIVAGVETRDDGIRFRFPFTLAPSYHARARSATIAPGQGELELPDDRFGDVLLPPFHEDASDLHRVGFDLSLRLSADIAEVASPSHGVRFSNSRTAGARAVLASEGELPNRDLVLDARTEEAEPRVLAGTDDEGRGRFAAIVPSRVFGEPLNEPRRVVFVIDRSGSMKGSSLRQALRAVQACLGALSREDELGIVAFDFTADVFPAPPPNPVTRLSGPLVLFAAWNSSEEPEPESAPTEPARSKLVPGTAENRAAAAAFLSRIRAGGGTEMAKGLNAAADMFGNAPGDVILVTDGQVFGSEDVIREVHDRGVRVHCLGIGDASQDRFLSLLARRTGGVSRFLTTRERIDVEAVDLFAASCRPVAAAIRAGVADQPQSRIEPAPPASVFPGQPLVLMGDYEADRRARLEVSWQRAAERVERTFAFEPSQGSLAETLRLIQGARLITDCESQLTSAPWPWDARPGVLERRGEQRAAKRLEALSKQYGLASRAMALVAVVERSDDRRGELPRTRVAPVGLPSDTPFMGYFAPPQPMEAAMPEASRGRLFGSLGLEDTVKAVRKLRAGASRRLARNHTAPRRSKADRLEDLQGSLGTDGILEDFTARPAEGRDLIEVALVIEPDGGMPGEAPEQRTIASLLALLSFLAEGHTPTDGAFREHVRRLVAYLEALPEKNETVVRVLELAKAGQTLPGNWIETEPGAAAWNAIEAALQDAVRANPVRS